MSLPAVQPRPCNECPWRRASIPGWLGPFTADEWNSMAHGEIAVACHTTIEEEGNWDTPNIRQCAGIATFRSNVCKSPRDPEVATLPADRENVFGYGEFVAHHESKPTITPNESRSEVSTTIRVTGLLEIDDDEVDPDDPCGMTEEAFIRYSDMFNLDDIDFRPVG